MTERDSQFAGGDRRSPAGEPPVGSFWDDDWREHTTPDLLPVRGGAVADPSVPGWGAETGWAPESRWGARPGPGAEPDGAAEPGWWADAGPGPAGATAPDYSALPVAVRRPDAVAALLVTLAGAAAAVSLLLRWVHGSQVTGWTLVRDGIRTGGSGVGRVFQTGYWEPLAVVFGGAALFVVGLLLFLPARSHRFLGVLAWLSALVVTAGVLTPMAQDRWRPERYDLGMWFAAAVAGLGLLGSLKALLTGPRAP